MIEIAHARSERDYAAARAMFGEYADSLGFSLAYQGFDREVAELPGQYAPPTGALLLARDGEEIAGMVALRRMTSEIGEMKRLYVRPSFRGRTARGPSVGRALAEAIVGEARAMGYERVRLDTVASSMQAAIRLYGSMGFVRIPPYYASPVPDTVFLELVLNVEDALRGCAESLATPEALASIRRDPYWPKWDSPWWHMTLLWEMGEAARIPRVAAEAMTDALEHHYIHFFPLRPDEVPPGLDTARHGLCHCAVGTMCQVLTAAGIDVYARLPWIREWFLRYQMADGGWNCDEGAYLRPTPRSSFLSTLPVLEAVLLVRDRTAAEEAMLDRGAEYLLSRRLCQSISKGAVADPSFLEPTFPRFYFYDVLRGLAFVRRWAALRRVDVPADIATVRTNGDGAVVVERRAWANERGAPRVPARASTFELLELVSVVGEGNPWLTRQWRTVLIP